MALRGASAVVIAIRILQFREIQKNVCSIGVLLVLAPSPKPTKHEKVMAMLEELSKQFEGFQDMMKQSLDKLCALE